MSIARALHRCGIASVLYDQGVAGRGASWAAAGMLAAGAETEPGEEALYQLGRRSLHAWPEYAIALEAETDRTIGYNCEGTLLIALTRDEGEQLRRRVAFQQTLGINIRMISIAEARSLEPALGPQFAAAAFSPDDVQIDNRALVAALQTSLEQCEIPIHEHQTATLCVDQGQCVGIEIANRFIPAARAIIAAGAWSGSLPGLSQQEAPPVRPLKGQMLSVAQNAGQHLIRHVVWGAKAYLVPRADGRILIGATVEERGWDSSITVGGMLSLLEPAWRMIPALEDLPIDETWTGFRPGSRDDAPLLGESTTKGVIFATGHHRNGILLTPVTAEAICELITTGALPDWAGPFAANRFII